MRNQMILTKFDLQLFAEEKTEKATPKKKRDARLKGQVVQSKDISVALVLLVVPIMLNYTGRSIAESIMQFFQQLMNLAEDPASLEFHNLSYVMYLMFMKMIMLSAPLLLAAMVTAVATSYFQVGFLFTMKTLQVKFDKLNPISGFKRMFSLKSLMELAKAIMKAAILVYICSDYLYSRIPLFISSFDMQINEYIVLLWTTVFDIIIRCAAVLFVLGIIDYVYKKWQNEKDLRMSKKDIKDEYKQSEGDPQLKAKIKEKQRSLSASRMMQDVPQADVIITNPTHYAIAIAYDSEIIGGAPRIVAKGKDLIAQNIKRIAGEHDVPIVENKPLARALYASADLGDYIPEELYGAVAEVLAYVYSLKK